MRIRNWSSDVCSSDLSPKGKLDDGRKVDAAMVRALIPEELAKIKAAVSAAGEDTATYDQAATIFEEMSLSENFPEFLTLPLYEARSEAHTSELQSLMRISYAVFCSKNKTPYQT